MMRYTLKRLGLSFVTVAIVATVVFFLTRVLPGDAAKRILGRDAEPEQLAALREQLGLTRPLLVQFGVWIGDMARGDLGDSIQYGMPVSEILLPAIVYSARLAGFAFALIVPVSILAGVVSALRRGRPIDRVITVGGLSTAVIPEFVWAVIFVLLFGVTLEWLPVTAFPDDPSAGTLEYLRHLLLPSLAILLVLFGYIARITRAGVIEALDADYTRTAVLKGLPMRTAVRRHVLRNALLPTIAVIASQIPYLIGGLVAVEIVFAYPGFGSVLLDAVSQRDYPMLQAAVMLTSVVIVAFQLVADLLFAVLNPRIRTAVAE